MEKADWEKLVDSLIKKNILRTPKVIRAMRTIPRRNFLPSNLSVYSATDIPLPIGFGQTTCAPNIVSLMSEALEIEVGNKILEVGSGSGWQTCILAEIVAPKESPRSEWGHIYSLEIIKGLAETARKNIMNEGYGDRITTINENGYKGYSEKAPYDRILVTASVQKVPESLVEQLKSKGIMLIPVGSPILFQNLKKFTKQTDGKIVSENLGGVTIAPLVKE